MNAIEFNTRITDGKIEVPAEYIKNFSSDVKIIIIENQTNATALQKGTGRKNKSIKGIINHYANPKLIPLEKEAWGEAAKDKHDIN